MSTSFPPLTPTLGGRVLQAATHPRYRTLGPVLLALVLVGAVAVSTDGSVCTAAAPCGPDHAEAVGFGLLLASALVVRVSGPVGVALGSVATAWALAGSGLSATGSSLPAVSLLGYTGVLAWVAWRRHEARRAPRALLLERGAPAVVPSQLGVPTGRARWPRRLLAGAAALLAAAVATTWYGAGLGREAAAAEAAAQVVVATVADHVDEYVIAVEVPGVAGTTEIDTFGSEQYPVGSRQQVWLLPEGDVRLLAEPYDATVLDVPAVVAAALAAAQVAKAVRLRRERAAFDAEPQPVSSALGRRIVGEDALVYPAPSAAPTTPLVALPTNRPADARGEQTDDADEDDDEELPPLEPVTVIGVPAPDHWVAVRWPDGTVEGPVRAELDGLQLPAGADEDMEELALRGFSPDDLAPRDRTGLVTEGRHQVPGWAQGVRVVLALLLVVAGHPLLDLVLGWTGLGPRAVAALAGLLALELTWRFAIRPRLAWDGAGVSVVGPFGPRRSVPWAALDGAFADGRDVHLVLAEEPDGPRPDGPTPDGPTPVAPAPADDLDEVGGPGADHDDEEDFREVVTVVAADPRKGPLHAGWRTAAQLRAVLLSARRYGTTGAAHGHVSVTTGPAPRRPWALLVLWVLVVSGTFLYG
ncbi:hypothetical protein ATJ97_0667 [Georgenia soli]|uniref:Uncharacterized protein n=1 Tax=Georgenia soli TaxID=638953 RepID=A0A2A9EIW5_9MICO|nr:hypothetical protein [Georgenia soli]PFG38195.1 hypothetical protein ATJ97_0667 [Georgenia soli]